jgi:hypothetical protein
MVKSEAFARHAYFALGDIDPGEIVSLYRHAAIFGEK